MEEINKFKDFITLNVKESIWEHFYTVAPLIVVGTKENNGFDLAPKHMVTPIGFSDYIGFVCTPRHNTYHNILREKRFTISFVKPDQILLSSLAAFPRCSVDSFPKDITNHIPTISTQVGENIFIEDSYVLMDCDLHKVIDGFDDYSIITGKIKLAMVHKNYKIISDEGQQSHIYENPLLAYIAQGRFASVKKTMSYPFPKDFHR